MKQTRVTNPLPYYVYLGTVVFLTLVGLADSIYLAISHYRVYTDIGYKSFCAISRAINCDTVSQSPYAIMLNMPVAIWGILGYSFILILLFFAGSKSAAKVRIWSLIFWVTLIFSGHSVILALISTYLIGSYCILCIVSYGVNLALLFYAWLIRRRFSNSGLVENTPKDILFLWKNKAKSILLFVIFFAALIFTWAFSQIIGIFNHRVFLRTYQRESPHPVSLDRCGKRGPRDHRVFRLPVFSMLENAFLPAPAYGRKPR